MSKPLCGVFFALVIGCHGTIEELADPAMLGGDLPPIDLTAACDPSAAPSADLLRIDRQSYQAALRSLFGDANIAAVASSVEGVPNTQSGQYGSEVEVPSFDVVSSYVDVASGLAFYLTDDLSRLNTVSECMSSLSDPLSASDEACISDFIDDFGLRLTRRPLSDDDHARFAEAYAIGAEMDVSSGVATLLMSMLLDPRFLYHFEIDGTEEDGVITLTSYEVAARLARVLWRSIPDDELLAAASAGFEGDAGAARLRAQIDRMWETPEAREGFRRFVREWTALRHDGPAVQALLEFVTSMVHERDGTLAELFLDRTAFIEDDDVARVYGLPGGTRGEVELDAEHRAGMLTRAGWLATTAVSNTNAGHIIHRGKALSELLCMPVPPPDDNLFPDDDPAAPTEELRTIRQRFNDATAEQPCLGCHVRLDGFGAPFGNFDFEGAFIEEELAQFEGIEHRMPIDSSSTVDLGDGERIEIESAVHLSEVAAQSESVAACLSVELTENMMGRWVTYEDACLVQAAQELLSPTQSTSIRDALFAIVTSPSFRVRSVPEAP